MLMQHSLGLFLFHSREVRLPRKGGQGEDLIGCALGKNFLKVRSFPCCSFLLSIDSCLVEHIVSNHSGNKASSLWVNGHMDSFPSLVSDHLSLGLLSFYTRLYWLTVTRGACQYKITPEEKRSWISFLIGFTLLHGVVWWFMARAYDLRKCNCTVKYRLLYVSCLQFTEIVMKLRP